MSAVFVTATGTDVGKTFVTEGIIRALRRAGRPVDALKPIISGFDMHRAAASDSSRLLTALGRNLKTTEINAISPWRFKAPLSPDMASRLEGASIDFEALLGFCRKRIAAQPDALLIEGVGGIMVPLDDRHTVLDWMAALNLPVLLVAGSYLGTISHTLSALDVLDRRRLQVTAVVVSESATNAVDLDETVATIRRFSSSDIVGLPRLSGGAPDHYPAFARLADLL
ncbi:MAG: dethiobiotin synthase [Rhodospirillales bacterium]|nr:dethiobiotin synthase [Rhodospirillales bacterium]